MFSSLTLPSWLHAGRHLGSIQRVGRWKGETERAASPPGLMSRKVWDEEDVFGGREGVCFRRWTWRTRFLWRTGGIVTTDWFYRCRHRGRQRHKKDI